MAQEPGGARGAARKCSQQSNPNKTVFWAKYPRKLVLLRRELMKNWLFLAIAIFGEVVATSTLKSSGGFSRLIPSIVVAAGYGIAFYFLSLALKCIPVGIAYAIWAGSGIVLVTVVAWIVHGQKPDMWAIAGMSLIICGVAVLNMLSKVSSH